MKKSCCSCSWLSWRTAAIAQKVFEMKLAHADSTDISVSRKHAQAVAFADLVNTRSGGNQRQGVRRRGPRRQRE